VPSLDHNLSTAGAAFLYIVGFLILVLAVFILAKGLRKGEGELEVRDCLEVCFGRASHSRRSAEAVLRAPLPPLMQASDAAGMPMLCPELLHDQHTRLAIPAQPLMEQAFEMDILSYDASPLLTASRKNFETHSELWISLYQMPNAMAIVSDGQVVFRRDGQRVGGLEQMSGGRAIFRSTDGRPLLELEAQGPRLRLLLPARGGKGEELARVTRRDPVVDTSPGDMNAAGSAVSAPFVASREHYELVASPRVDAVLVISTCLAFMIFGDAPQGLLPRSSGSLAALGGY
jgi:hypothetical protein